MPAAIPSRTVDLPDPFSPTKNVTGVVNSSASSDATTGTVHGNPRPSCDGCRRSAERYTHGSYSGSPRAVPPLRGKVSRALPRISSGSSLDQDGTIGSGSHEGTSEKNNRVS